MQRILRDFGDTRKLGGMGLPHSWHKRVPVLGKLEPEPQIADPGVFRIRPFGHETAWQPVLLNGAGASGSWVIKW